MSARADKQQQSSGALTSDKKKTASLLQFIDNRSDSFQQKEYGRMARKIRNDNFSTVLQRARRLDLGDHGHAQIPDGFHTELEPDQPKYGSTNNLLGDQVASSMEAIVTPNHPQGSSPKTQNTLFSKLPTKGDYKLGVNQGKPKNGSTLYIKGHLLNDNLGGPGTEKNLFPITHQANVDHDTKIEEPIKDRVNKEGGIVYYKVEAQKTSGPTDTDVKDSDSNKLKSINGKFTCTIKEFDPNPLQPVITKTETIDSVWGGTDNSDKNKIAMKGQYAKADAFVKDKVKIMPRARIKKEWDEAYRQIATSLSDECGIGLNKWLDLHVDGIGKKGGDLLKSAVNYNTLSRADKTTLTKAQRALEKFIKEKYNIYLSILQETEADDSIADEDKHPDFDLDKLVRLTRQSLLSFEQILTHYPLFMTKTFENPPKTILSKGATLLYNNSTWIVWQFQKADEQNYDFLFIRVASGILL